MRAACAALLACLTSCVTPAFAERLAPTTQPRDLLAIVFPAWHPTEGAMRNWPHRRGTPWTPAIAHIRLPALAWPWLSTPGVDGHSATMDMEAVQITPLSLVRIDESHVALLTVAEPVGRDCHYGCIMEAGVYFFDKEPGGWRLGRRLDLARELDGELPGKISVRRWPGHGKLLSLERDNCYQGICVADLDLLGFAPNQLLYAFETTIRLDDMQATIKADDGSDHDCYELLSESFKADEDMTFDVGHCHQGSGTWRIDGNGIAFGFEDAQREVDEAGHLGRLVRNAFHARVELRNGRLELVSGKLADFAI